MDDLDAILFLLFHEFSFAYYETADSEAFIDFAVGDTVNIEYEPGVVNARQVTALSASVSSTGSDFEVTVGDVVENAIAVLNKKDKNNQNSHLITTQVPGFGGSHPGVNLRRPVSPPSITSVTPKRDGVTRSVTIAFKTPGFVGTQSLLASKITGFEAEVYLVSDSTVKHTSYKAIDRTSVDQTMVVTGMGERGSSYTAYLILCRSDERAPTAARDPRHRLRASTPDSSRESRAAGGIQRRSLQRRAPLTSYRRSTRCL